MKNLRQKIFDSAFTYLQFFSLLVLLAVFSTSGSAQNANQRINDTLRTFENLIKHPPSDELNKSFVDTYFQEKPERLFRESL